MSLIRLDSLLKRAISIIIILALLFGFQVSPAGASADPAVAQGQATRLYSAYFLRLPDLDGLRFWIDHLMSGGSLHDTSQFFAESEEFKSRYGSIDNTQFVELIYANVLGRAPDSAGRTFWVNGLESGQFQRGGVMVGFSESPEFVIATGTTPPQPSRSFGDGLHTDVAGTWRNISNEDACYWERLSGFGGSDDEIIDLDLNYDEGRTIVTIEPSDAGFYSLDCGTWVPDVGPITISPDEPFAGGTFRVGRDISPGTWQSDSGAENCYWARLSGFRGVFSGDVITNNFAPGLQTVTISPSDEGFQSSGCGLWVRIA